MSWDLRLAEEITAAQSREWEWGRHDCASFAIRCVMASGHAPRWVKAQRGRWKTAVGAARVIRNIGGIAAKMDMHAPRIEPAYANRGDIVLLPGGEGGALGVYDGRWVWCAADPGLSRTTLDHAKAVWRVRAA